MKEVLRSSIFCKYCDADIPFSVFGDDTGYREDKERFEQQAREHWDHSHWIDHHRRCAICGEILRGEDLELARNAGIVLHEKFKAETLDREPDTTFVIVHRRCIPEGVESTHSE